MKNFIPFKSAWMLIFAFVICFGTQAQVYTGDLILSSQAEVNAFNYTVVTGHLDISGNDITDLTALSTLTSVGGYLRISDNTVLSSLAGLENLTSVDGLGIVGNVPRVSAGATTTKPGYIEFLHLFRLKFV